MLFGQKAVAQADFPILGTLTNKSRYHVHSRCIASRRVTRYAAELLLEQEVDASRFVVFKTLFLNHSSQFDLLRASLDEICKFQHCCS
jgi:hypothetical protein